MKFNYYVYFRYGTFFQTFHIYFSQCDTQAYSKTIMKEFEDELKAKLAQFRANESSVEEFSTLTGLRGNTI